MLYNRDGYVQNDAVRTFPGDERVVISRSNWSHSHSSRLHYKNLQAANAQYIFRVWTGTPEVEVYDHTLAFAREIPLPHRPEPVTDEDVRWIRDESVPHEEILRRLDGLEQRLRRAMRATTPDYWPSVRELLVDGSGHVWVCLQGRQGERVEWLQVTAEGEFLQRLELPSTVRPLAVDDDRVYMSVLDEEVGGSVLVAYEITDP